MAKPATIRAVIRKILSANPSKKYHYVKLTEEILIDGTSGLERLGGETPEQTVRAHLGKDPDIRRVGPGEYQWKRSQFDGSPS